MEEQWRVMAASVTGSRHAQSGAPCQDAHNWRVLPSGVLLAAIADGAGSSTLGGMGAVLAAEAAIRSLAASVPMLEEPGGSETWQTRLREAMREAQRVLAAKAAQLAVVPRELATTLIVLEATPTRLAAAQIGDGAVVFRDIRDEAKGVLHALTTPRIRHGEYVNETTFLTAPHALNEAQVAAWEGGVSQVAILSDGLQRLALRMPDGAPHGPFFAPLFQFAGTSMDLEVAEEQLRGFLVSPRVKTRTDDDLTLLLATRLLATRATQDRL